MSQPPYPPPGGADTGDARAAGPPRQDPSERLVLSPFPAATAPLATEA